MADNVTANAGSGGATFATDDDGTAHHPYTKIEWGADNTQTKVDTGAGALPIQGSAAENAAASANPVQMGGRYDATPRTLGDGDVGGIALDADGAVHISDGGNTITVDGTVTANLSTTDNTVLDNIDTNTTGLAGCVGGTELQVDVVGALPAGTNAIGKLSANSGVDIGDVDILSIAAGSNLVGDVGLSGARTSGGTTIFRSIDLDESEEEIKATAGQVYWIHAMNLSSTTKYLKFYNATAATVVVGTTTPVLTYPLATQGDTNGAGFALSIPNGIAFGTAITVAATTGIADSDTGAPGANEVVVNIGYA